jgi:hypothetical protein
MFWVARQPPDLSAVPFVARSVVLDGLSRATGVRAGMA